MLLGVSTEAVILSGENLTQDLCYIVLCCVMLHCVALCCAVLCCVVLSECVRATIVPVLHD